MPLQQLFLVLRSRVWLVLFVAAATVTAGTYMTMTQPVEYTGTAKLLLSFGSNNPLEDSRLPPQLADSYIATQVDIITSRHVMQDVIDRLGLAGQPDERNRWMDRLTRNVEVEAGRESRIVTIYYHDADPAQAADIANAFANAYADTTQHLAAEPAKRNTQWFGAQIEDMRGRLSSAQSRLTGFQQEKGIVALDERLDTETTRLSDLANQLVQAQAEVYDVRSRQLGRNHPEYRRAVAREESLRQSLAEQKEKILALKQQRDELSMLAREVNVEQDAYESALQAYYNEQLRSSLAQTTVEVLDPAVPPDEPSSPNVTLNLIGSLLLGGMLAGLMAIGAEFTFRKVRNADDVSELLDSTMLSKV